MHDVILDEQTDRVTVTLDRRTAAALTTALGALIDLTKGEILDALYNSLHDRGLSAPTEGPGAFRVEVETNTLYDPEHPDDVTHFIRLREGD